MFLSDTHHYLFSYLFIWNGLCHLLQCSPLCLKMLPISWGKSVSGLPSPSISPWWFASKWHIEAALLKWCGSPELLNTSVWCIKCSSAFPWPRAQLCLPVWIRMLHREGGLEADLGVAGTAEVTAIFYPYPFRFLVFMGNSHAGEGRKSCNFIFTARAFPSSCATLWVTSAGRGTDSVQAAWGLFKAEHI